MELSRRIASAIVLIMLLFTAQEMRMSTVEARTCESPSHKFKGTCLNDINCANVCATEGFDGGKCEGIRRRCFCTKPC